MDYHPSLFSCWWCTFISAKLSALKNSQFKAATHLLNPEYCWMIICPMDNLHGGVDICKSKAGKIFVCFNYSSPKSDNPSHQLRTRRRDHIGYDYP